MNHSVIEDLVLIEIEAKEYNAIICKNIIFFIIQNVRNSHEYFCCLAYEYCFLYIFEKYGFIVIITIIYAVKIIIIIIVI